MAYPYVLFTPYVASGVTPQIAIFTDNIATVQHGNDTVPFSVITCSDGTTYQVAGTYAATKTAIGRTDFIEPNLEFTNGNPTIAIYANCVATVQVGDDNIPWCNVTCADGTAYAVQGTAVNTANAIDAAA